MHSHKNKLLQLKPKSREFRLVLDLKFFRYDIIELSQRYIKALISVAILFKNIKLHQLANLQIRMKKINLKVVGDLRALKIAS